MAGAQSDEASPVSACGRVTQSRRRPGCGKNVWPMPRAAWAWGAASAWSQRGGREANRAGGREGRHCLDGSPLLRGSRLAATSRSTGNGVPPMASRCLEPLPPPLPWLILLDGTFLSISGGKIHRMPAVLPEDGYLQGCVGNWLFLRHCMHVVRLPNEANARRGDWMFLKLVPLSSTTQVSPNSLFAVLITTRGVESDISICRPSAATAFKMPKYILDVAFLDGKVYALSRKKIFAFEVDLSYKVFEVDLTTNSRHKWTRVNTLGDQALFVGVHSKSLSASRCGAQEACIYFVSNYGHHNLELDPLCDCGVFNMRDGIITPLLPDTMVVRPQVCIGRPTWFFPH
ncbi:LOW QUALITY PROTEIN: hypothetical protein BDA96_01G289300 [Sorghum bicolor]|uniref:KIB1-4 beta-propeller domain-containing protein n=1 Tax=Sorghum bicolor TaxID=4558 RepID=A0A921S0C1_SORBI|nr:LOW QUALITY PROTEIN: hypothetical protein BDA96_01G289300 [Sorghum bicolor]